MIQNVNLNGTQRRSYSKLQSMTSWVRDVLRTKSLQPPNPILTSIQQAAEEHSSGDGDDTSTSPSNLPQFSAMLPYHFDTAAQEVIRQYQVDLAELEVLVTGAESGRDVLSDDTLNLDLVQELDRIEAPVYQLLGVGSLFRQLAALPEDIVQWNKMVSKWNDALLSLPLRQSTILYKALQRSQQEGPTNRMTLPKSLELDFQKRGAHLKEEEEDERADLIQIQSQLTRLGARLSEIPEFSQAKKKQRLQAVSDMYNVIGLSHQQAQLLRYDNVAQLEMEQHMADLATVQKWVETVREMVQPHIPQKTVKLDAAVSAGAFLGEDKSQGVNQEEKEKWEARRSVQKLLNLDGVLQGLQEFGSGLLGLTISEQKENVDAWQKDVRLFHVRHADTNELLGSIYLDPYERQDKSGGEFTTLFSKRKAQTSSPIAVVSMNIQAPAWDDEPTPMNFGDTRTLLYEMGKAIQMLLQANSTPSATVPLDCSEMLGNVSGHSLMFFSCCSTYAYINAHI